MERVNNILEDGFLYGFGLFETIKVINNIPLNLKLHFKRIKNSAKELSLNFKIPYEEFQLVCLEEIKNNIQKDFVLRFSIVKDGENIKYFFSKRELTYTKESYNKGFKLKILINKRNSKSKIIYHKTLNYLENYLNLMEVKKDYYNDGIYFNENDYLCEGCTSNIFIIKNNIIYTPQIRNGLLNGIMRQLVIKKLKKIKIDVLEKDINYKELLTADEVFVTNSLLGIMKVVKIEDVNFKSSIVIDKIKKALEL